VFSFRLARPTTQSMGNEEQRERQAFSHDASFEESSPTIIEKVDCKYCNASISKKHIAAHLALCSSRPDFTYIGSCKATAASLDSLGLRCPCGQSDAILKFTFYTGHPNASRRNSSAYFESQTCRKCSVATRITTDEPFDPNELQVSNLPNVPKTSLYLIGSVLASSINVQSILECGELLNMLLPSKGSFSLLAPKLALCLRDIFELEHQPQVIEFEIAKATNQSIPIKLSADFRYHSRVESDWVTSLYVESFLGLAIHVRNTWTGEHPVHDYNESIILAMDLSRLIDLGVLPFSVTVDGRLKSTADNLLRPGQARSQKVPML
jgi:hypothetical protein